MCSDNLTGIKEVINAAFPDTIQQRCIVYMIRNNIFRFEAFLRLFQNNPYTVAEMETC